MTIIEKKNKLDGKVGKDINIYEFYDSQNKRFNGTAECGYEFYDSKTATVKMHTHDYYEFFLVTEGDLDHEVNGKIQKLQKGDLVFVRDFDIHRLVPSPKRFTWINVNFSMRTFNDILQFLDFPELKKTLLSPELPPVVRLSPVQAERCIKKTKVMENIAKKNNSFFKLEVRKQLLHIFSTFFLKNDKRNFLPEWLDTLCVKMRDFENFSVGASRMYELNPKSKSHLIKSMQQYLNTTVSDFINEQRVNFATEQLINTNLPVIDIALDCGFNNVNYFYRLFKKVHGDTPHSYRKKYSVIANLSYSLGTNKNEHEKNRDDKKI